jgi:hypothetical protein
MTPGTTVVFMANQQKGRSGGGNRKHNRWRQSRYGNRYTATWRLRKVQKANRRAAKIARAKARTEARLMVESRSRIAA